MRRAPVQCDEDVAARHPRHDGIGDIERINVRIIVSTEASSDKTNDGKLVIASRINDGRNIEIVINGSYQWSKLQEMKDTLVQKLYKFLFRELTNIIDLCEDGESVGVEEFADEALARAESYKQAERGGNPTQDMILDHVRAGKSFKQLDRMSVHDRVQALKAVYSALVDAGYV